MSFLKKKFPIIGHRGAMQDRPQNTRSSFDRALACGADGIEFDVQLSADGVPVIYHDRSMRRINGSRRRLSDYSLKELRLMDWGSWYGEQYKGESLLTFKEILERYAGKCRLLVEIKSRKPDRASGRSQVLTHKVAELLDEFVGEANRSSVSIISFDKDVLSLFHKLDSRWSFIWNVDSSEQVKSGYTSWMSGVCLAVRRLEPRLCDYVHGRHGVVMTYTCNTMLQLKKACESGVDLIMTDDPCSIISIVKQQGGGG